VDSKGLTGVVRLIKGASLKRVVGEWKVSKDGKGQWKDYTIGQDVFDKQQGTAWFRALLPEPPAGITKGQLVFRSVDENATVYLNGRKLARHEGWNIPFKVSLEGLDTMRRPLELTVFIENYSNEGGIDQPVKVCYLTRAVEVTGWRMRGGVNPMWGGESAGTGLAAMADWMSIRADQKAGTMGEDTITPCFYRATFDAPAYGTVGDHLIWRVVTKGLGHGSVWVNGHNLGRYPEKTPAPGLYIPECWMKAGDNELFIFDEDGKNPAGVAIVPELAASRKIFHYINGQ
jgi:beta-galactosidase